MYAHLFDDKGEKIPNTIIILNDEEEGADMLLVGRNVIAAYFPEFGVPSKPKSLPQVLF